MAGITLAIAEAQLAAWLAASTKTAQSQSYEITTADGASRRLTRADAAEIREQIKYWSGQVNDLSAAAATTSGQVIYAGRVQ